MRTARQLEEFINLPFELNKSHPLWVPNLRSDDRKLLSPDRHPFWQTAERELFLVRKGGRPIGRIAAIIDRKSNEWRNEKAGVFGFFECADDLEAARALLEASRDWSWRKGMEFIRGPFNPSTNYTCGVLVQGFDLPPALMMPWNPVWYPRLIEQCGFFKEEDLLAYTFTKENLEFPDWLRSELAAIKSEARFHSRHSGKKTLKEDVAAMLEIYRESWARNWGFSPLSREEAEILVKELSAILDPAFFILFFHKDMPVAGMVALPDLTPLLKRLKGRIGITAPWHMWQTRKVVKTGYRIMLFGILPEFRLHGLPMLLLDEMLALAKARPELEWVEGSWILEDNSAMAELIEDFGGQLTKRYRIYRKDNPPWSQG